jgi:hypothetical protein
MIIRHLGALSHCWGLKKPLMTTSETLSSHLAGMKLQDLPKTFREAIDITRGIGIQYLWIDSLCIIQGDKQDWHQQAEKMAMVYGRAHLTIAASGAEDSTQGCFPSPCVQVRPTRLPFYEEDAVVGHFYLSHNKDSRLWYPYRSPLRERAWAMQEWYLSRRTLHCTEGGLSWKCKRVFLDERNVPIQTKIQEDMSWGDMIRAYTMSKLTYPTDRLIALRGIIKAMEHTQSDRNYFGIWSADVPRGLLWTVSNRDGMVGMSDVPSWSWAAKHGAKSMWGVWASEAWRSEGGASWQEGESWIQSNMTGCIDFVGCDGRVLTLEGYLFPCLGADLIKTYSGLYGGEGSPERSLLACDEDDASRIYALRQKKERSISNCVGVGVLDDLEARDFDDMSGVFCAYMVAGERCQEDSCLRNNHSGFECGKPWPHIDSVS